MRHKIRVLLDTGSTISILRRDVADAIGLVGQEVQLELTVAGGQVNKLVEYEHWIQLTSLDNTYVTIKFPVITSKKVTCVLPAVKLVPSEFEQLHNARFTEKYPQKSDHPVDLLLDEDMFLEIMRGTVHKDNYHPNQPKFFNTALGSVLAGAYQVTEKKAEFEHFVNVKKSVRGFSLTTDADFQKFMTLEDLGVTEVDTELSKEDEEASQLMREITTYSVEEKRYTTGLLWKRDPRQSLDSNYLAARNIAKVFKAKSLQAGVDEAVNAAYADQIDQGYAELVPPNEEWPKHPVYYIPSHWVARPDALTTKTRIVMNASSKCKTTGLSLNDCLYQGPTLLPDLVRVLLNFRCFRYVTVCDISKMFWQIAIKLPDADCLRYMWKWTKEEEPLLYRALCVTFGLISAPYQAIATVLMHCDTFEAQFPEGAKDIKDTLYMDDASVLRDSKAESIASVKQVAELFRLASMMPHKWNSNDINILKEAGIPEDKWAGVTMQKVLGVQWDTSEDVISFDFVKAVATVSDVETKRTLIQQAARIFDPLGLIAPFTLAAKLLFQRCWAAQLEWDEPLPADINAEWLQWCSQVEALKGIKLPRLVRTPGSPPRLAVFADASAFAYGVCVYIVSEGAASLLFAKTRVAPVKQKLTVARLELLAALIAARVAEYVANAFTRFRFSRIDYFTDSLITLWRIRNGEQGYKIWVANRVKEILERSSADSWYYVPGQLNPADVASRSCGVEDLINNTLWWSGPNFILKDRSCWPEHKTLSPKEAEEQNEEDGKEREKEKAIVNVVNDNDVNIPDPLETIFEVTSSWPKVIRLTCYWLRFLAFLLPSRRKSLRCLDKVSNDTKTLTVNDQRAALGAWIRRAQVAGFGNEYDDMGNGNFVLKKKSFLQQLAVYYGPDKFIRSVSRLSDSELLPFETREPILLPKHNKIVERVVLHMHVMSGHTASGQTLYQVQRMYRLVGGKQEVSRIIHLCRKRRCVKPVPLEQRLAPLPTFRTDGYAPWVNIAIDYFGPFEVRHDCDWKKNSDLDYVPGRKVKKVLKKACPHPDISKAWGIIFTCLQTRAIHLEAVVKMDTTTFLQAFTRMTSRRGLPHVVWSDNAKTFKRARTLVNDMIKQIDWQHVEEKARLHNIDWQFGTEKMPSTNGVVERMVRSVKEGLRVSLIHRPVAFYQLETFLIEVEALVNDRPLASPSATHDDHATITPALLCLGRPLSALPFTEKDFVAEHDFGLLQRARTRMVSAFWRRWRKDYLLAFQAVRLVKDITANLEPDQVVLLREENLGKGTWTLARIMDTYPGRDGRVRRVKLKTAAGIFVRHINQISLLEGAPLISHQKDQ